MWYNGTMARKPRLYFPTALYHVILRGNARQDIFFDQVYPPESGPVWIGLESIRISLEQPAGLLWTGDSTLAFC